MKRKKKNYSQKGKVLFKNKFHYLYVKPSIKLKLLNDTFTKNMRIYIITQDCYIKITEVPDPEYKIIFIEDPVKKTGTLIDLLI